MRRLLLIFLPVLSAVVPLVGVVQPAAGPSAPPAVAGPVEPFCVYALQPVGPSDLTVTVCTPPM